MAYRAAVEDQPALGVAQPAPPDPVLTAWQSGDVKALQAALNAAGSKLTVDGKLGPKTNAALATYQNAHPTVAFVASPAATPVGATQPSSSYGGGGGGGGGTITKPAAAPASAVPRTDAEIRDYVRSHYGYLAAYLDDPEVGQIILDAAKQGVTDPDVLRGKLFNTQFWQHTTESQRQFDSKQRLDPATANQQIADQVSQLTTQAKQMGLNIAADRLNALAKDSLRNGWNNQQIQQALGHEFVYKPTSQGISQQTGGALTTEQTLKQIAGDYLVPLSDSTLAQWEQQIISGDVTTDQFKGYAQEQAKSLFPGLAKAIDSGITVKQYISPYANIASQELERPADSFDFTDPKFMRGISTIDPKTGDRTAMNLSDWQSYLRSMPEWKTTNRANDMSSQLTQQLLTTFGATT